MDHTTWRPVEGQLVHGREGWTNLLSPSHGRSARLSACPSTLNRPSCCRRHPRAPGCRKDVPSSVSLLIGDDMYLKPRGQSAAALAPSVVRGFLSCSSEANAQLSQKQNETAHRRADLWASPLPVLAIVYFGTHLERLSSLRAYERYFTHVVYMSPSSAVETALQSTDRRKGESRAVGYRCRQPNKVHPRAAKSSVGRISAGLPSRA